METDVLFYFHQHLNSSAKTGSICANSSEAGHFCWHLTTLPTGSSKVQRGCKILMKTFKNIRVLAFPLASLSHIPESNFPFLSAFPFLSHPFSSPHSPSYRWPLLSSQMAFRASFLISDVALRIRKTHLVTQVRLTFILYPKRVFEDTFPLLVFFVLFVVLFQHR